MRAQVITDTGDLGALEDDWRELAVARANAFITPEWFVAWRDTLAERQLPFVLEVRHDSGHLAGVMPLAQDRANWPRATRFAGSSRGDRFGIAARKEDEAAVATAAIAALEHMERAPALTILHRVDAVAGWPEVMAQAAGQRLTVVEQSHSQLPYATVQGLDWAGYLATRSHKFRQRVARGPERALNKDGISYAVRDTADASTLEADLDTLFRLHDLRWTGRKSSISDPKIRDFLRAFAAAALERGWLRLRILELDGSPAAACFGWRIGSRYALYQSGFDPAWADRRAGMVLLNDTVRSAITEGAGEIDMLRGEEPYKLRFATGVRKVRTVILVPAHLRVLVSAEAAARRRGRRIAQRAGVGFVMRSLERLTPGGRQD